MRGAPTQSNDETLDAKVARVHRWRERMLDAALVASCVSHLVGSLVHIALAISPKVQLVVVCLIVGFLHLASRAVKHRVEARSVIFIGSLFLESVFFGAYLAWSPAVVLIALFGTVYGGLLLGRTGAFAVLLGYFFALLTGGLCVRSGWTFHLEADLDEPKNWLRNSILFFGLTGVMALALRRVLNTLGTLREVAEGALKQVTDEAESVEVTRTTRVATELVVQEAQQLQTVSQLSGGVAHLINNTLTVVRDAIDQLVVARSAASIHESLEGVVSTVERAATTMRALLVFSRRGSPKLEPVAIDRQIGELQSTLEEALPRNISLSVLLSPTPPVAAEAQRVRQLILNLVLNARDAISNEGNITLSTKVVTLTSPLLKHVLDALPAGQYVTVVVSDNGSGMQKQVLARACEPFFTTRDPDQHEGLGLSVAFGLLKQWGGTLSLQSRDGHGTIATAYIPTTDQPAGATQSTSTEGHRHALTGGTNPPKATDNWRAAIDHKPSTECHPIEQWKEAGLQRVLLLLGLASGLAWLAALLLGRTIEHVAVYSLAATCIILLAIWRLRSLPMQLRFGIAVAILSSVMTLILLRSGFMSPGAMAGHATVVLLAAVYSTELATWLALLLTTSVLLLGMRGPAAHVWLNANVDPNVSLNWFRVAIVLPLVMLIIATMVLDVLATASNSLSQLDSSLARLLLTRNERELENRSLLAARRIAQRAPQLETAGRLAGAIAHDLNNALGGILGWAMLLREDPNPSPQDVKDAIAAFGESTELAEALVAQLQPQPDALLKIAEATNVEALVHRTVLVLQRVLRSHIRISTQLEADCWVPITENALRRILLNLATNARDAMPHGGEFALACRRNVTTGEVTLEVQDTGLGMDNATQARVFDAFFTTKSVSEGTGLGLHTVAQLVEASGGRIELHSALGNGTRFCLHWPLAFAPESKDLAITPTWTESRGAILLAEDNDWVRRAMVRGLARAGYQVMAAIDGTDARNHLDERDDWIALCTDAIMPGYSSARLIEDFHERFPNRPILVCSGHLPNELSSIAEGGKFRFLAKPFSPAALTAALQEELGKATDPMGGTEQ